MAYYYDNGRPGFLSNIPPVTKNIILINALVMIMTAIGGDFMYENFALF